MNEPSPFELPKRIHHYLATISKIYAQHSEQHIQQLIVNAQVRVIEGTSFDNWNGGMNGHNVILTVPESVYLSFIDNKRDIEEKIKDDLNKIQHVQDEFFDNVFIEMEDVDSDWRKASGMLVTQNRTISPDATRRIWGDDGFRIFLSHKSNFKSETANLKKELKFFGISAFVAHEDIHPTKAWQDEIENALTSMDGFVALMTPDFHESDWTDQEVGYAFARGVPIIAVRLGRDPYGFLGKFQGLRTDWSTAAVDIANVLIKNDRMLNAYINALSNCPNWDQGNTLAKVLPSIEKLSVEQVDKLIKIYNETQEIRGSFGFNGTKPTLYGLGLVSHLNRLDPKRNFEYTPKRFIEQFIPF